MKYTNDIASFADVFAGRNASGDRVFLSISLRRGGGIDTAPGRTYRTTDHREVVDPTEASFTFAEIEKGRRAISSYGAGFGPAARSIVSPAPGWTLAELAILADLADEWHLNCMIAGCDHQGPYNEDPTQVCGPTGYVVGSAWLVRPLPVVVEGVLAETIRRHS